MSLKNWFRPPRHLLAMFFGITLVSAAALGWLSWELVRQDRALAIQRTQEQRDSAADRAVAALQRYLSTTEERLTALAAATSVDQLMSASAEFSHGLTRDSVVLILRPGEVEAHPATHLLYHPVIPSVVDAPADAFAKAEAAEFRELNYAAAVAALADASQDSNPVIRVEALVRLGRIHRKAGQWEDAMAVYEQLSQIHDRTVRGVPAALLARTARCEILESVRDTQRLRAESQSLYSDLQHGKWQLIRPVYDVYAAQLRRTLGAEATLSPPAHATSLAEAVQMVWHDRTGDRPARARHVLRVEDQPMLVLTKHAAERTIALVLGAQFLASKWLPELQSVAQTHNARIALTDSDGHPVIGRAAEPATGVSLRGPSTTGLPWTVHAISLGGGAGSETFSFRSRLVVAGLFAIALLVVGGGYLIARAVARELAAARLQSDFVTAVSHEFRTPLTALRQLSELLAKGRVPNDGVRQQYYEVLEHESARLHRLVEGLLNFGRMQAGAMRYNFETVDAAELLRSIVGEFRTQAERRGCRVEFDANGTVAPTRADREALGCVVWNLLDNAVKYSPDGRFVWLELGHENDCVAIRVRDQGVGIPPEEQTRIFQKFVRGKDAASLGVQGAGIGLAVVHEIVTTHGGEIKIDSTPGAGSTFTVLLPAAK